MPFAFPRAVLFAFILIGGFTGPVPETVLRGQVTVNPAVASARLPARLPLIVKSNNRVLATGFTKPDGFFELTFSSVANQAYDIFCLAPGPDSLYLKTIGRPGADTAALQLLFPCQPDTTSSGEVVCPRCRREDQVFPMTYGDPIVITRHFDTTGQLSYERTAARDTAAGLPVHAARYYCRRDKIIF